MGNASYAQDRVYVEIPFAAFDPHQLAGIALGIILDPIEECACMRDREIDLDRLG
jgi:hypothetical protein